MNNKSCCSPAGFPPPTKLPLSQFVGRVGLLAALGAMSLLTYARPAAGNDAPPWMHTLVNTSLPAHDEKTDAVLLYSEYTLTVFPNGKIKSNKRAAYKILRVGGKSYGTVVASFDAETRVSAMHGWCIPAQGKDYEVKDKDAIEAALGI